ncbi:nucleotidyltransferase family protein [Streptomyces antibioticus]
MRPNAPVPARAHGSAPPGLHVAADGSEPHPPPREPDLPADRSQAILETTKKVGAVLKRAGHRLALAGSVAVYAQGGSARGGLQHDADFCVLPEDAEAVAAALRDAGLTVRVPPEDWLLKTTCLGQDVDIIFELSYGPVTAELLDRADDLPVDSVQMPVLSATDLLVGLNSAFSEHHCDFGAVLPVARALREKVDWTEVRRRCGDRPMPAAFLYLLERLNVIEEEGQGERQGEDR